MLGKEFCPKYYDKSKILRRETSLQGNHIDVVDSETESDDLSELLKVENPRIFKQGVYVGRERYKSRKRKKKSVVDGQSNMAMKAPKEETDLLIEKANKYQKRMKKIPIPKARRLPTSFVNWQALANYMKQTYQQPLHYLTMSTLKHWDEARIGTKDEAKRLDHIIGPNMAEDTFWTLEEYNRKCASAEYLANAWLSDPMHPAVVDPVIA